MVWFFRGAPKKAKELLWDERGATLYIVFLVFIPILALFLGLVGDYAKSTIVQTKTLYALESALRDAAQQTNPISLAHNQPAIDQARAKQAFIQSFVSAADMSGYAAQADGTVVFYPSPTNKTYPAPVVLLDFQVYNQKGATAPNGVVVDRPSVYGRITFPVDLIVGFSETRAYGTVDMLVGSNPYTP